MGVLIIEDDHILDGIPSNVLSVPVLTITLQHFDVWDLRNTAGMSEDEVLSIQIPEESEISDFYLVNGDLQPDISVNMSEWTRFRMVHSSPTRTGILSFGDCDCEILLLAKDGVYLPRVPRVVSQLYFTESSRVDLALRCSRVQSCPLTMNEVRIATLHVVEKPGQQMVRTFSFPCWTPCFPEYLRDLRDLSLSPGEKVSQSLTIEMGMSTINGEQFSGFSNVLGSLFHHKIQQWDLVNTAEHPLHIHVHHFQIISEIELEELEGWTQAGDWIDTIANSLIVTVRFRPLDFEGFMLIHCHIPAHSDQGSAALFRILPAQNQTIPTETRKQICGVDDCGASGR